MRALKFAGAFLLTLIVVFLVVFGYNLEALFTLFENQQGIQEGQEWVEKTYSLKGLTEYIGEQPQHVSVVSLAINNPDSSIHYNTRTPRTMGRLANIFLITEYARRVENGTLNPDQQIPFSALDRYQLPFMDESDHDDALNFLREQPASTDTSAALRHVVKASVAYTDIAIADFLLFKLSPDKIDKLFKDLSIEETEAPLPYSGLYITLNPHLQGRNTEAHFDSLSNLSREAFGQLVVDNTRRFLSDHNFRNKVFQTFEEGEGLNIKFTSERDGLAFFPKTTAHEMAALMKQIQQEKLISETVSNRIKNILDWPLEQSSRLNKDFARYGAIYDNRMGMVNGIDYGASTYSNEPFAQAVFFDNLQVAFWFHMSSNLMHQDYQQRLIWDPALRSASVQEITTTTSDTSSAQ